MLDKHGYTRAHTFTLPGTHMHEAPTRARTHTHTQKYLLLFHGDCLVFYYLVR